MSYAYSVAFHQALREVLKAHVTFYDDENRRGYDQGADNYVMYAGEQAEVWDTKTDSGLSMQFTLSVFSKTRGMRTIKELAGKVCTALLAHEWALSHGRVVLLEFQRTDLREKSGSRRLDMKFRTLLEDAI